MKTNQKKNLQTICSYTTTSGVNIFYHDLNGDVIHIGDKVEVQYNSGRNLATPNKVIGVVTAMDDYGYWTLDNPIGEINPNPDYNSNGKTRIEVNNDYDYEDNLGMHFKGFEKRFGWEYWVKKIN